MKKFTKTSSKNKRSFLSLALASILTLSFNYSPITLFSDWMKDHIANAYESSSLKEYYPNSSTTESNVGSATYPKELAEYFSNSSNNFNIQTYYNERFANLFATYSHEYLSNDSEGNATYKANYLSFLDYKGYNSLSDYYTADSVYIKTTYGCESFIEYVEYFVSNTTEWTDSDGNSHSVEALFPKSDSKYRSAFYTAFANHLNKTMESIPDDGNDGLPSTMDDDEFYDYSISYGLVKTYIDNEIIETVAIYSYDGVTQNNNMASIFAEDAPVTNYFYYDDSTYETQDTPNLSYVEETKTYSDGTITMRAVYYWGTYTDISNSQAYKGFSDFFHCSTSASDFYDAPLQFRQIQSGEFGYVDASHPTYYKYTSVPYSTTNSIYNIYVYDNDGVTEDEQATYDSLFMTPITQAELDADERNAQTLAGTNEDYINDPYYGAYSNLSEHDLYFYVNVPYSTGSNGDMYYKLLISNYADGTFENFCDYFAPDGQSRLYLKIKVNQSYIVYIDSSENSVTENNVKVPVNANKFISLKSNYDYKVVDVDFENGVDAFGNEITRDDFFKVTTSYSAYYQSGYTLYFKKVKVFYEELITDDSVYEKDSSDNYIYETENNPYIPYEMNDNIPSESYEIDSNGKIIYAVTDDETFTTADGLSFVGVSQATINLEANRNFYVEISDAMYKKIFGDAQPTTKMYYKHTKTTEKQIYVLDDDKDASSNEVYKNLNYKVLTTTEYKENSNHKNFVALTSSDPNYNESFALYYKYATAVDEENIYVQNSLRDSNAVFIIDDSLTSSDKSTYSLNLYTVITTEQFNAESEFYVQITSEDSNYSTLYTKLYYKYKPTGEKSNLIYLYSSSTSTTYETFYNTDSDYVASDYKLITKDDPNYVPGLELYYKKIRTEKYTTVPQSTYYYYKSTSTVTLTADSYYAVSFYVNTTGTNAQASFYITDSNGVLDDIKFEHIQTNGKWVKYIAFIATDALSASAATIYMYLGDRNSIAGNTGAETITGSILFDEIKFTTINETDYTKRSIDDKVVESTESHTTTIDDVDHVETIDVIIANDDAALSSANKYDYRTSSNVTVAMAGTWSNMFDFDSSYETLSEKINNLDEVTSQTDGYSSYNDYWQYYIGRDVSGQGNNYILTQYQEAYMNNELTASIIEESSIDKTVIYEEVEEEDDDDDDEKEEDKEDEDETTEEEENTDVPYLQFGSTFRLNNKVLKLENKNKLISLGLTSNYFTIEQFQYYKITIWVYSPEETASATVTLNSVLSTAATPAYGSLLTSSITANANIEAYTTTPSNEYGWIPLTFYIEGNTLHNQQCSLVLSADKKSTVYFDNITIENISSTAYDSASSDSNNNTAVLSLIPSSSVVTNGITNGYFNNITLTKDYSSSDYNFADAKTAESWTANSSNSTSVVAGVVSTNSAYTALSDSFYKLYNNSNIPYAEGYSADGSETTKPSFENIYAVYANPKMDSSIANAYETGVATVNNYKIYSSSISLSASSIYEVSFEFQAGYQFDGDLVANIYYSSVDSAKIISAIKVNSKNIESGWNTYTFYIATSTTSATVYLEFGVENAVGTSFFKNASCTKTTQTLEQIRNNLLDPSENVSGSVDLYQKESLQNVQFVDLSTLSSTIHAPEKDELSNTYKDKEYSSSISTNSGYTVGQTGVAVATFYTEDEVTTTYTVTIDEVVYYIGRTLNEETDEYEYNLYQFEDCCEDCIVTEISDLPVTVESYKKVVVGENDDATEYNSDSSSTTSYLYTFEDDVTLNNVVIPASELTNKYSQNVLILANSYSTDYLFIEPSYTSTLNKTSYLVLKVYVKTSDFADADFGLNISVSSISTKWSNVNTTTVTGSAVDEQGYVCYQTLIKTGDSSITSFGVKFSLGDENNTGAGYAIIADIELVSFGSEDSFDHYAASVEDDETTVKKYYADSKTSDTSSDDEEDEGSVSWATFFYVFSSLLLVLTIAIAIAATILKNHPIKTSKKVQNDHEKDLLIQTTSSKKSENKKTKKDKIKDEETDSESDNNQKQNDDNNEGIV